MKSTHSVLILTGGFLSGKEESFLDVIKRQIEQWQFSKFSWLESMVKLTSIEPIIYVERQRRRKPSEVVENFLNSKSVDTPELTEVILATLLEKEGISYKSLTIDDFFSKKTKRDEALKNSGTIFLSTTFLRDLSEITPIMNLIKTYSNKVVLGGPLTQLLKEHLHLLKDVDLVTLGYGEFVVPSIAGWIKSGHKELLPPPRGKVEEKGTLKILYSGHPEGTSLDSLETPDWALAQKYHGKEFQVIHYESVRGCPYRCSFCNYPYLFNDDNFRYKSAKKNC